MSATERHEPVPRAVTAVPMRDLLAACAAAHAISTPPRVPDRETLPPRVTEHREAA
ncbi:MULTISPECIES: hypothetical protein [unclassified Streptomyces]|uniref:hypothetical protein n=1 Tax=unclassified Streptomyces TaxID=2593676 RepID=UPI0036E02E09